MSLKISPNPQKHTWREAETHNNTQQHKDTSAGGV